MARALGEMIRLSDNDATAYLLDVISDTCPGPNLEGRALAKFIDKRRVVNRWFATMGYDISAMAKPWSFGPFGREKQLLGGDAAAESQSLQRRIRSRRCCCGSCGSARSPRAGQRRDAGAAGASADSAAYRTRIRSRSSSASRCRPDRASGRKRDGRSEVRHDAAYIELPGGRKMILVIMTRGTADDVKLIPAIAKSVLSELQ